MTRRITFDLGVTDKWRSVVLTAATDCGLTIIDHLDGTFSVEADEMDAFVELGIRSGLIAIRAGIEGTR